MTRKVVERAQQIAKKVNGGGGGYGGDDAERNS